MIFLSHCLSRAGLCTEYRAPFFQPVGSDCLFLPVGPRSLSFLSTGFFTRSQRYLRDFPWFSSHVVHRHKPQSISPSHDSTNSLRTLRGMQEDPSCEVSTASKWPIAVFTSGSPVTEVEAIGALQFQMEGKRMVNGSAFFVSGNFGYYSFCCCPTPINPTYMLWNLAYSYVHTCIRTYVRPSIHTYMHTCMHMHMQSPFWSLCWDLPNHRPFDDIPRIWGSCEMYTQFLRDLASYGMVVIAIEHEEQLQLMKLRGVVGCLQGKNCIYEFCFAIDIQ